MTKAILILLITVFAVLFIFNSSALAKTPQYEGLIIIDNAQEVSIYYAELNAPSKYDCLGMINEYFRGMKLDCPQCSIKKQTCALRNSLRIPEFIRNGQRGILPYVQDKNSRTWFVGLSRDSAIQWCEQMAQLYNSGGIESSCIK